MTLLHARQSTTALLPTAAATRIASTMALEPRTVNAISDMLHLAQPALLSTTAQRIMAAAAQTPFASTRVPELIHAHAKLATLHQPAPTLIAHRSMPA